MGALRVLVAGWKTEIVVAVAGLVFAASSLGYLDEAVANKIILLCAGAVPLTLGARIKRLATSAIIMIAVVGFGSSPAVAADCDFDTAVDAKVVRFAWPPAVGVNALGFIDFEFGMPGVTKFCGNLSGNIVGGACLIPKLEDVIGGFCSTDEPDPVE